MNEPPNPHPPGRAPPYIAFLVRCWRDGAQQRFVLENVATREKYGFATLEAFLEGLQAMLAEDRR